MLRESKSFGRDIGVDLRRCSVAVFENVVLVVQVGESFDQGELVPKAMVDPEGQLAWCQLAGQHPGGKCSRGGFLSGDAARWVEGEAQFVECRGKQVGDVVIRLRACARGQDPQSRTVEAGNECITGSSDDVGCGDHAHPPENGTVLKLAGCWFGRRHLSMISSGVEQVEWVCRTPGCARQTPGRRAAGAAMLSVLLNNRGPRWRPDGSRTDVEVLSNLWTKPLDAKLSPALPRQLGVGCVISRESPAPYRDGSGCRRGRRR